MARDSKTEKVAKQMVEQMTEHVHDLQSIVSNPASKELDVERWVQSALKSCLGFSASNGYAIRPQETKGKMRPDLIVVKADKPVVVIEVKKLDFNLDKADLRSGKAQLKEYLHALDNVAWGILCNGYEWRLYDFSNQSAGGVLVQSFDFRVDAENLDTSKKAIEELCGGFVDLHESMLTLGYWRELSREASAFSPESLARAILSSDIVRGVARNIRGEHDFKVNTDVLFEKIADVLERGLNDAQSDWGDSKRLELQKFIKAQKRAMRKKRKTKSDRPIQGEGVQEAEQVLSEARSKVA